MEVIALKRFVLGRATSWIAQISLCSIAYTVDRIALLCCSVRRNICYGLEEEDGIAAEDRPSQQQIEEAARLANAHDFIAALPQGYDMVDLLSRSSLSHSPPLDIKLPNQKHPVPTSNTTAASPSCL